MKIRRSEGGFTLMELLVVIAIIGILASVVLASLSSAREKGRNANRVQQVKEYMKAIELDRASNTSYYIATTDVCLGSGYGGACWSSDSVFPDTTFTNRINNYLPSMPKGDTVAGYEGYTYGSDASGSNYQIRYVLEGTGTCGNTNEACPYCQIAGAIRGVAVSGATICRVSPPQ